MFNIFRRTIKTDRKRTIKTARTSDEINKAAKKGYRPLIKEVVQSEKIRSKTIIFQNKTTGEIMIAGDFRIEPREGYEWLMRIWSYPYRFDSPYAAYLIPKDLKIGEKVFLEDIIEDYVGWCWNQGDASRLDSCDAIWNGKDFDILYKEKKEPCVIG